MGGVLEHELAVRDGEGVRKSCPVDEVRAGLGGEMGEVVRGSIHYRALFMVGLVLFVLTLGINYGAQKLVARYRMSIG